MSELVKPFDVYCKGSLSFNITARYFASTSKYYTDERATIKWKKIYRHNLKHRLDL